MTSISESTGTQWLMENKCKGRAGMVDSAEKREGHTEKGVEGNERIGQQMERTDKRDGKKKRKENAARKRNTDEQRAWKVNRENDDQERRQQLHACVCL